MRSSADGPGQRSGVFNVLSGALRHNHSLQPIAPLDACGTRLGALNADH